MVVVHNTDLLHTLDHHQTGRLHPAPSTRLLRSHPAFLYRLRPVPVSTQDRLNHHSGCVNRLCWSPNGGTYLGSVSDDRTIRVWVLSNDQVLKKCRTFPTLHQGNVFGIRFLDSDPDQLRFATGSREGTVCVTVADQTAASSVFRCHRDSVMEIEQSLDRPGHVFWSASDDCTVRQWDLRCPVRCRCRQGEECTSETILIDGRRSVGDAWRFSSICSSPTDQNLILTGCGIAGRLFDRRMLSPHSNNSSSRTKPCQVFMPSWLSNSSHDPFVTHTNFSPDGRRIVVNYNCDHAYVFSIGKAEDEVSGIPMVNPRKQHDQDPDYFRRLADEQVQLRHWDNSVRLYSNALSLPNVTPDLKRVLLVQRSKALLNRRWLGDTFAALRDVQTASSLLNGFKDVSVMNQLNECLDELGQIDRAADLRASSGLNGTALDGQVDYATRLVGHANIETGIKEATFLSNDIVGCASDDGIVYVYDAASGVILHTLSDGAPETLGLNTVRSHPNLGVSCIATSGLDHHIQLFTATGSSSHCTYNDDHRYLVHFNQQSLLNNHSHLSVRHLFFFRTVELEDFDE